MPTVARFTCPLCGDVVADIRKVKLIELADGQHADIDCPKCGEQVIGKHPLPQDLVDTLWAASLKALVEDDRRRTGSDR